jgi:hypothetical protein
VRPGCGSFPLFKGGIVSKPDPEDLPRVPWAISAAYLYILDLDDPSLAWEYLRRHPGYRKDWDRRQRVVSFVRWGLQAAESPELDARTAHPLWLVSSDKLLHVRPTTTRTTTDRRFDLWRIPGRKRLALEGSDLTLTADTSALRMKLSLSGSLSDGAAYASSAPMTPQLRGQLDLLAAHAQALEGLAPQFESARKVARSGLLHLRALQALDASQAGASHRDIAQALFGLDAVVRRWHADGELRAQVRYLLRRAEKFMAGGYLSLVGVSHGAANDPGEKTDH